MTAIMAVHTTGVNWQSVLITVAAIAGVISVVGGYIVRSLSASMKDTIHTIIASDVSPTLNRIDEELSGHDTRIARLEGIEEGRKQAVAQASVTKVEPAKRTSRG